MTTPTTPGPAPHLVLAVGARARAVAQDLCRDGDRYRTLAVADDAGPVLDEEFARLPTGWQVLAVGIERDVSSVRAAALARGALDEEVTVLALDVGDDRDDPDACRPRRIHCGYCHRRFDTDAAVGDLLRCPGCNQPLTVAAHHSRTHGTSLGAPRVS
jgi:dimethylamine monooxygenase subunit C